MSEQRKIYIQFTGVSASGKTTICNELKKLLEKEDVPYIARSPFLKKDTFLNRILWGMYLLRFIDFNAIFLFGRPSTIKKRNQKFCLMEYLKTKYHLNLLQESDKKVLLYDGGGFVNLAIHGVLRNVININEAINFIKKTTPSYTIMVDVRVNTETTLLRTEKRSGKIEKDEKIRKKKLEKLHYCIEIRKSILNKLPPQISVISLNGEKSVEENAKIIMDNIKKRVDS